MALHDRAGHGLDAGQHARGVGESGSEGEAGEHASARPWPGALRRQSRATSAAPALHTAGSPATITISIERARGAWRFASSTTLSPKRSDCARACVEKRGYAYGGPAHRSFS